MIEFERASYSRSNLIEAGKMLARMHKPQTKAEHKLYSIETLRVADRLDDYMGNGGSYCRDTYFHDYLKAIENKDTSKSRLDTLFKDWYQEAIWEVKMTIGMIDKGEVGNTDMV
jgi:hypothetical protein